MFIYFIRHDDHQHVRGLKLSFSHPFLSPVTLNRPCSKEFQLHRKAEAKFLQSFFQEWRRYASMLEEQQTLETVGAPLDPFMLGTLSEEQRQQLSKLKAEAQQLR